MTIISYLNKLANFSKYRSSCLSSKDLGSVRANWIWIRPNLQWSLETQSLFPPPPPLALPPHSGIFQIRCRISAIERSYMEAHISQNPASRLHENKRENPIRGLQPPTLSLSLSPFSPLSLSSSLSSLVCTVHVHSNSR